MLIVTGLGKGGKKDKSLKSKLEEADKLDETLDRNKQQLDSCGAFLDVAQEQRMRKEGDVFKTEGPIQENLNDEVVFLDTKKLHTDDLAIMKDREISLTRWKEILNLREELTARRLKVEMMVKEQQLQEREMLLRSGEKLMELEE